MPRILVVDDDVTMTGLIKALLTMEGHETTTVNDSTTAVEVAASVNPDVITLDLMMPGLTGFDALRALAMDGTLALPMASHPSFLGANVSRQRDGLAPAVMYGLLPRLAGADLSIYPGFDTGYFMTKEDCVSVAVSCRQPWDHVLPAMPSVGGRIGPDCVAELVTALGRDVVLILGSRVQQDARGVVAAVEEIQLRLTQSF